jgi:hypothetical protein
MNQLILSDLGLNNIQNSIRKNLFLDLKNLLVLQLTGSNLFKLDLDALSNGFGNDENECFDRKQKTSVSIGQRPIC